MKKTIYIILFSILSIVIVLILWDQVNRRFFYFSDGRCFTIWKRVGGNCYFIPSKYFGLTVPNSDYILTTNQSSLGIIYNKSKPDVFVIDGDANCQANPINSKKIIFYNTETTNYEFETKYTHLDGHYRMYNAEIEFYTIDLLEMDVHSNVK